MATTHPLSGHEGPHRVQDHLTLPQDSNCTRCGGLMVRDFCTDLLSVKSGLDCPTRRCVQCGDVVDPVIRWNRHLQQSAGAGHDINTLNQAAHRQPSM